MKTCEKCGGLQATVIGEMIAGTPCKCPPAPFTMRTVTHDGITHPIGPLPPDWPQPTLTFTSPSVLVGKYIFSVDTAGRLWLSNGEGESMEVNSLKLERVIDAFFKNEL